MNDSENVFANPKLLRIHARLIPMLGIKRRWCPMKRYNIVMVYDQEMKRILFCKRKKRPYLGKLNFPGGKWEEGETYIDGAYRELR